MSTPERVIGTGDVLVRDVLVGDEPNGHGPTMTLDRLTAALFARYRLEHELGAGGESGTHIAAPRRNV